LKPQTPLRFRLVAAGLHAIFTGSIGAFLGLLAAQSIEASNPIDPHTKFVGLYNLILGSMLILILPVIVWICWLVTRRIHDVINIAGRDAINCTLNNLSVILALAFVFGTTCGVFKVDPYLANNIMNSSLVLFDLVAIAYAINSTISSVFTLRGNRFNNRLIYPFLQDE
jgi:uncharacterized Tic20 family protein